MRGAVRDSHALEAGLRDPAALSHAYLIHGPPGSGKRATAREFAAALIERFGVRRVVALALGAIAVSALLTTRMTETWQLFLLWGLVNGLATGAVSVPLAAIIANRGS